MIISEESFASKTKKFGLVLAAVLAGLFLIFLAASNFLNQDSGGVSRLAFSLPGTGSFGYSVDNQSSVKNENVGSTVTRTERKIAKSGSLSLLVKETEESAKRIQGIAEELGGFVISADIYNVSQDIKSGRITVRVPADKFNAAFEEIKKTAVKVQSENSDAQDVTEQYIDLDSRLKNLKAQEEQYLEIMKKALSVQDILSVSGRLGETRGQIEQLEGQLKYLARQVEMSSITATLSEEGDVEVFGINWRPLYVAKQAIRSLISGLADYADTMIKFIFQLPVILLWLATVGLIILLGWKIMRFVWKKINNSN